MNNVPNNTQNRIEFNFTCYALKLLGQNLYSNPWTAVSEIVANGIDAKANNIYILVDLFDKNSAQIEIIDDGYGMNYQDLCDKYTIIGRNKRIENPSDKTILGRKGVGKLAALYLSDKYYLFTKTKAESSAWCVNVSNAMDDDIPSLEKYDGESVIQSIDIWNKNATGTAIKLTNVNLHRIGTERLKALPAILSDYYLSDVIHCKIYTCIRYSKTQKIVFEQIQKHISFETMYELFDNTGKGYLKKIKNAIYLNKPSELPKEIDKPSKTIKMDSFEGTSGTIEVKDIYGESISANYNLKGWIGLHGSLNPGVQKRNNPAFDKTQYHPNAIRLYVRGKLAVDDLMAYIKNTQAFANYIEGEISFDILDDDRFEDISTSNREGYKRDDVRVIVLLNIVGKIVQKMVGDRSAIGSQINNELKNYLEEKRREEERQKQAEIEARIKAEEKSRKAEQDKINAEKKQKEAEEIANREKRRSQYILNISEIEDKNIMNSVHSIYNMSCRAKQNIDNLNNDACFPNECRKKIEKISVSNQKILTVSKVISKAGKVIDDNDAVKTINLSSFVEDYVTEVASNIYSGIDIECIGNINSIFSIKIKPLSFVMILDNIIGNAIKAKATSLKIIVDDSSFDKYQIIFKDNGTGIDETISNIDELFEFGVTTTNGSGLGLYFAKKRMKDFKGEISIQPNDDKGVSVILSWNILQGGQNA